jgi:hypothetical protein
VKGDSSYDEEDAEICAMAARMGHLEILKWARADKCLRLAKKNGDPDVIEWIKNQPN